MEFVLWMLMLVYVIGFVVTLWLEWRSVAFDVWVLRASVWPVYWTTGWPHNNPTGWPYNDPLA